MRKLLLLLFITISGYSQTLPNPIFGTVTIKNSATVTTTPALTTTEANGLQKKIDPANLPISTAAQTALNTKANDADVLHKTGNLNESANGEKIFTSKIGVGTLSSPLINTFEAKVATGTGFSGSEGIIIHDGQVNRLGLNLGVNTSLSYAWLQSSQANFAGGRALSINPLGGNVTIGASTNNGYKFQVEGGGQTITHNNQGPSLLIDNGSNSEYIEFKKTGYLDRVSFGALGGNEANVSYNMDYATGVHKYYDPAKNAMWLAMNPNVFAVQFAPSGLGTSGDMWTLGGSRYLFLGDSSGRFAVNTNLTTNRGDSQMMVVRNTNKATLTGDIDLVLEGNKQSGTAGPVYTNRYNTGTTYLNSGGGVVGIGIPPANVPANILEINTPTATGSSGTHGVSLNDQAVNKQSLNLGINTAGGYSWLQSSKGGVGLRPIFINPNGGGVSIGNTTDAGTGNLNIAGKATAGSPATVANDLMRKGEVDTAIATADAGNMKLTGNQSFTGTKSGTTSTLDRLIELTNNSTSGASEAIRITANSGGIGSRIYTNNTNSIGQRIDQNGGTGLVVIANSSSGSCIQADGSSSTSPSVGVLYRSSGSGVNVIGDSNSTGNGVVSEMLGSGLNFVGKNNSGITFTVDKTGQIKSNALAGTGLRLLVADASGNITPATTLPVFADNTAAVAGGLGVGRAYRTVIGLLAIVF